MSDEIILEPSSPYIVTSMVRGLTLQHRQMLAVVAAENSFSLEEGRVLSSQGVSESVIAVEQPLDGPAENLPTLQSAFMAFSESYPVDVVLQSTSTAHREYKLACFDMDSTLIEAEVIDELAVEAGVGEQVSAITEAAMRGELDFNQSFEKRMALLQGLDASVLPSIAERLTITEGAERLFKTLRKQGCKTAILSGGFDYFARYLQSKLSIDFIYANPLDIDQEKLTGNVIGPVVNGERKARLLCELAKKEELELEQVIAVGDGANDLPMLNLAGLGVAFRAKPLVVAQSKHAIKQLGLDAILYLMGLGDSEINAK